MRCCASAKPLPPPPKTLQTHYNIMETIRNCGNCSHYLYPKPGPHCRTALTAATHETLGAVAAAAARSARHRGGAAKSFNSASEKERESTQFARASVHTRAQSVHSHRGRARARASACSRKCARRRKYCATTSITFSASTPRQQRACKPMLCVCKQHKKDMRAASAANCAQRRQQL